MSIPDEEPGVQQPIELSLNEGYFNSPKVFDPDNIFNLSGHGKESTTDARYPLKSNQYALIPGRCGSGIYTNTNGSISDFFLPAGGIRVFNSNTRRINLPISNNRISYFPQNKNKESLNIQELNATYKLYNPRTKNTNKENRVTLPPLNFVPVLFQKITKNNKPALYIAVSGILRKTQDYKINKKYSTEIPISEAALDLPFGVINDPTRQKENDVKLAKVALNTIKEALSGSMLTYENIIAILLLKKNNFMMEDLSKMPIKKIMKNALFYRNNDYDLTIKSIFKLSLPIKFIFNFLDNPEITGNKPYLVIMTICRSVSLPEEELTRRRAFSVTEAAGGGGGGAAAVEEGGWPVVEQAGGTRRRKRRHKKRTTRRKN